MSDTPTSQHENDKDRINAFLRLVRDDGLTSATIPSNKLDWRAVRTTKPHKSFVLAHAVPEPCHPIADDCLKPLFISPPKTNQGGRF